jgi:hypothetical protein
MSRRSKYISITVVPLRQLYTADFKYRYSAKDLCFTSTGIDCNSIHFVLT